MGKCKVFLKKAKLELINYIIIEQIKLNVNGRRTFKNRKYKFDIVLYHHKTIPSNVSIYSVCIMFIVYVYLSLHIPCSHASSKRLTLLHRRLCRGQVQVNLPKLICLHPYTNNLSQINETESLDTSTTQILYSCIRKFSCGGVYL